ncbi:MAG: hypothetical protein J6T60_15080 [Bacteroidales bacterium]|nr:hypothetical protein [Bacteroidales bacterium]
MRLFVFFISLAIVAAIIFTGGLTRILVILGLLFVLLITHKVREIIEDSKSESTKTSKYSSNNTSKYTSTSTKPSTSTNTSTSTDSSISPLDKTIAYEVVETLIDKQFVTLVTESDLKEAWEHRNNYDSEDIEYLKEHGWERCLTPESIRIYLMGPACEVFHCFACNSGGYCVLELLYDGFDPESVNFYFYKDGQIEKQDNYSPKPSISDIYANADKFPSEVVDYLSDMFARTATIDFRHNKLFYSWSAFAYDWDTKQFIIPKSLQKFYNAKKDAEGKVHNLPSVEYIWNGEEFVRDPENKPYEEDLSLFE